MYRKGERVFNACGTIIHCYIRAQAYRWAYLQLPTIRMPCSVLSLQTLEDKEDFTSVEIFLDPGAQISLIRMETTENLGLEGKNVSVIITKVGGEEQEMKTKEFKVQVTSPSNKRGFLIKAVGNPQISTDVAAITRTDVAELVRLTGEKIHWATGPVDLLTGIDHACLHTGETKQSRHLVARNSRLGRVVFEATSGRIQQANSVLLVSYSTPIDLSNFWTTEAMGVAAKPCICSADKLTQLEQ